MATDNHPKVKPEDRAEFAKDQPNFEGVEKARRDIHDYLDIVLENLSSPSARRRPGAIMTELDGNFQSKINQAKNADVNLEDPDL